MNCKVCRLHFQSSVTSLVTNQPVYVFGQGSFTIFTPYTNIEKHFLFLKPTPLFKATIQFYVLLPTAYQKRNCSLLALIFNVSYTMIFNISTKALTKHFFLEEMQLWVRDGIWQAGCCGHNLLTPQLLLSKEVCSSQVNKYSCCYIIMF